MGYANRILGYFASFLAASLFYVVWISLEIKLIPLDRTGTSGYNSFGACVATAIFFWLFGGTGAALILTALLWLLIVHVHRWFQRFGLIYFSAIGALITFSLGCAASSLSPKPLFIEDQTFIEGFTIAAKRQGLCLLLTGLAFGLTFWFVSERLRHSRAEGPIRTSGF